MSAFGSKADMNQTSLKADINTAVGFLVRAPAFAQANRYRGIGTR